MADSDAVDKASQEFFQCSKEMKDIVLEFGEDNFRESWQNSVERCYKYAETMFKVDSSGLPACCVCREKGSASYYVIHGLTAHKCLCSVCAMRVSLSAISKKKKEKNPKCPLCATEVDHMVEATEDSPVECVCGQEGCKLWVVVSQTGYGHMKTPNRLIAVKECHTCTLGMYFEKYSLAYELY